MEPNGTSKPVYFSTYRFGIDDKRRVQIPSKWRPEDPNFQFVMVVWPKAREGTCLRVMPPDVMDKVMQQLETMPNSDANKPVLKRLIGGRAESVTLDKAGRIILPGHMTEEAGITDEVVLIGMLDRFEIWSPERFKQLQVSDGIMGQEAFRILE